MRQFVRRSFNLSLLAVSYCCVWGTIAKAQVTPDNTVNTNVNQNGNVSEITGGQTAGNNLFHSFQDFSVPTGNEASFNNADTIENIFSRVTGGNVSNIDGLISASGSASLFLINPAGIIFGENASLNIGGSFIGSSADSILFPDDISFSASDTQPEPILTINAPIGLGFRDNPGDIVNRSFADNFGLTVPTNKTIALIGGDVLFNSGSVLIPGGRIEIGSVAENSNISLFKVDKGWDVGYENVTDFENVDFVSAFAASFGDNTGDVEIVGRNIAFAESSQIAINTTAGQAGNLSVVASESLQISGNGGMVSAISGQASGENSQIIVESPQLSLTDGGTISVVNSDSNNQGSDISVTVSRIFLDGNTDSDTDTSVNTGIFAQTFETAQGDGGSINIDTEELTINNGAQINSETFGAGRAGDIKIDASELVELTGTNANGSVISGLIANTRALDPTTATTVTGNGGNIFINTQKTVVKDGAQIASASLSQGTGGNISINASESILLSGIAPTTKLNVGRTGITTSTSPVVDGKIVPVTGSAGSLNIITQDLNIEQGAVITASTFGIGNGGNAVIDVERLIISNGGRISASSLLLENHVNNELGQGGSLEITATDTVLVTGIGDINGEPAISSIATVAEGTGGAGNLTLVTNDLAIADRGEINASATGNGAAGNLGINAQAITLERGSIRATTLAGEGGNITLSIADNLTLGDESQISAAASGDANGGNININSGFILASPSQPDGNDIIAQAERGSGGNIEIFTESLLGIDRGEAIPGNENNDIDASSEFGLDGSVTINVLDLRSTGELRQLPENVNVADSVQTTAQACQADLSGEVNTLVLEGKGGTVKPDEPLISTAILLEDEAAQRSESSKIQSLQTSRGKIVPAQGATVTKDGQIILTSSRTSNSTRSYLGTLNCG